MDKTEERYLIYGGAGLVLFVLAFAMMNNKQPQSGTVPAPSKTVLDFIQQNTAQADSTALQKAQITANSLLQYKNTQNAYELGLAQIQSNREIQLSQAKTAEDIANIQADAAGKVAQLQASTANYIAGQQAYAQSYSAYAQSKAQQSAAASQSNSNIWSSIFQSIGSIGAAFFGG